MSLFAKMFTARRRTAPSKLPHLGESSAEALQRVEAECDWSDAPILLAQIPPPVPETSRTRPDEA